ARARCAWLGLSSLSQYRRCRWRSPSPDALLLHAELPGDALRLIREDVARGRAVGHEPLGVPEGALGNLFAVSLEIRLHLGEQQQTFAARLSQEIGVDDPVARHAVDHFPVRRRLTVRRVER